MHLFLFRPVKVRCPFTPVYESMKNRETMIYFGTVCPLRADVCAFRQKKNKRKIKAPSIQLEPNVYSIQLQVHPLGNKPSQTLSGLDIIHLSFVPIIGRMCPRTGSVHHFRLNIIIGLPPREGLKFAFDINMVTGTVCSIRQVGNQTRHLFHQKNTFHLISYFVSLNILQNINFYLKASALMHFNLSWQSLLEATIPPDLAAVLM